MTALRPSLDTSKAVHAVSLKVLRLSRPAVTTQTALAPDQGDYAIDHRASLAFTSLDDRFTLTPGLVLPSHFGAAHVGETFACTLCINNESGTTIDNVKLVADMQTPLSSDVESLEMEPTDVSLEPGETLQRLVRYHLSDEGNHVMSATVSYADQGDDEKHRTRTFRKLYQFPAQQLIRVRIKTRPLPYVLERKFGTGYAIEAQLEKLGEDSVVLDSVTLNPNPSFTVTSLNNWDMSHPRPLLSPGDILQAAFLLKQVSPPELTRGDAGRVILGQMSIQWRGSMGEAGLLNTGWLSGRKA